MTNIDEKYPEHAKLHAISEQSNIIGEFIESSGYVLAQYTDFPNSDFDDPVLTPVSKSIENILAEYFGIDMQKIENEKREMLDQIRATS